MVNGFEAESDELQFQGDEDLLFADETEEGNQSVNDYWNILIVDDEQEVHHVTKMVLSDLVFEGKGLKFFDAYSEKEAKQALQEEHIAVVLLDVVMESDNSGLSIVEYIRDQLQNSTLRIILRTGQPGQAPEKKVILDFDINDYKEKTELTSQKLYTSIIAMLRSYRDLQIIEENKKGLENIISSTSQILRFNSKQQLSRTILLELASIIDVDNENYGGAFLTKSKDQTSILAGIGSFQEAVHWHDLTRYIDRNELHHLLEKKQSVIKDDSLFMYVTTDFDCDYFMFLQSGRTISTWNSYLIEIFCSQASTAFSNACLAEEIDYTQREVIFTLGEISELRSKETGNHVKRVAEYSKYLALIYGLSEQEAEIIQLASPMHDIGKVAIGDHIMNKPGKLTAEEYEIMKSHAQIGYDMLKYSERPILNAAAIIAHQHHEKYDGSGYPRGLKKEEIHLYGRITAIADVFDALASDRVYKQGWEINQIVNFFKKERGYHFDPFLTDLFLTHIDDFLEIKEEIDQQQV